MGDGNLRRRRSE